VVSLKQSLTEYERAQGLASELADTLLLTLSSLRQYVVDTEPALVDDYLLWADTSARTVQACINEPDPQAFSEVRTSIRAGLRDYSERAARYINELRANLARTTAALDEMLVTLQAGDSDAEIQLRAEITRLESLEQLKSVDEMRAALRRSAVLLAGYMAQLKQEKDVAVAQLRDEIRTLHNNIEEARRATPTSSFAGVYERLEFEKLLREEIRTGSVMSVVRLTLQNIGNLTSWYQQDTMDQLIGAFCKRTRGFLPEDTVFGRWRDNVFCALVHSADTQSLVAGLGRKCGGNYVCMDGARSRTLYLNVAITSYTCPSGSDADLVIQTLDNRGR